MQPGKSYTASSLSTPPGLDNNRKAIEEILAPEIVSRYYYERGRIVQTMKSDNGLDAAVKVLNDMAEYRRLLAPADKKSKKKK